MSTEATAENTTVHLTAEEHLADLQARALNGEPVEASALAEARAAVELDGLKAEGQSRRDRQAAEHAALQAQADAKAKAATIVAEASAGQALKAFDGAVAALEKLYAAVENCNDAIQSVAGVFDEAGVRCQSSSAGERQRDPDNHLVDPQNHAVADLIGGGTYVSVKVDGKTYGRLRTSEWVGHALDQVAKRHDGLPIPYAPAIQSRLGLSRPSNAELAEHLSA
ncbi:hypothetical protein BJD99_00995 [Rhodococcus sp. 1163]|uniref:hypothetical protein n=1 Tax=Rhodococcus sp. 1163 TaxID=1905289 RepID=UPI000A06DF5F|nr:hypothetical protein [Rhodococcus sp. 1163]ORI11748.1 hypothetical protein BJD99_00995 [Rhodococcus sp. 1163]